MAVEAPGTRLPRATGSQGGRREDRLADRRAFRVPDSRSQRTIYGTSPSHRDPRAREASASGAFPPHPPAYRVAQLQRDQLARPQSKRRSPIRGDDRVAPPATVPDPGNPSQVVENLTSRDLQCHPGVSVRRDVECVLLVQPGDHCRGGGGVGGGWGGNGAVQGCSGVRDFFVRLFELNLGLLAYGAVWSSDEVSALV